MARVALEEGQQEVFLHEVRWKLNAEWDEIAEICGVHMRTLFDWRREKYQMALSALEKLSAVSGVPKPENIEILDDYWYVEKGARLGADKRYQIYGNPGTQEGRRKSGLVSQQRRRENPELYIGSGVIQRKAINYPPESEGLAEFIGIVLGDGSITDYQVRVSVNSKSDAEYALFVKKLISDLFHISASLEEYQEKQDNTIAITASGINLVEFLLEKGLKRGDKVAQQVGVPDWIFKDIKLQRACVRGLIDTDGSVYYHDHNRNIGVSFSNLSIPLLKSVHKILLNLGFTAKYGSGMHVSLYRESEVKRYLEEVGTNNPKHLRRYKRFVSEKYANKSI